MTLTLSVGELEALHAIVLNSKFSTPAFRTSEVDTLIAVIQKAMFERSTTRNTRGNNHGKAVKAVKANRKARHPAD